MLNFWGKNDNMFQIFWNLMTKEKACAFLLGETVHKKNKSIGGWIFTKWFFGPERSKTFTKPGGKKTRKKCFKKPKPSWNAKKAPGRWFHRTKKPIEFADTQTVTFWILSKGEKFHSYCDSLNSRSHLSSASFLSFPNVPPRISKPSTVSPPNRGTYEVRLSTSPTTTVACGRPPVKLAECQLRWIPVGDFEFFHQKPCEVPA